MYKIKWVSKDIETMLDIRQMIKQFKKSKPKYAAFDTETDGLHIKLCSPFLFQFGWYSKGVGYTYTVDFEKHKYIARQTVLVFWKLCKKVERVFGHNVKYDMHMMENINLSYPHFNLSDTMYLIRFAHDNLKIKDGGAPLKLKDYSSRYISKSAKFHESKISDERTAIARELNAGLIKAFKGYPAPTHQTKSKSWGKGAIEDFFKDKMRDPEDLPHEGMTEAYYKWYDTLPKAVTKFLTNKILDGDDIPYNMVNRELVTEYGHKDIILTLEIVERCMPVIQARQQQEALRIEEEVLYPLFDMENTGFNVYKEYVYDSQARMKEYILERRQLMYRLADRTFTIGSHKVIKHVLNNKFFFGVESTDKEELNDLATKLERTGESPDGLKFIRVVQELRSLEKWYTTYLLRFVNNLQYLDRIYTTIHSVGAVSTRQTSDFQQFPREGIETVDGVELYNPRKMVIPDGGDYNSMVYIDYSQVELRLQGQYTILVGTPDTNLLRAYMPYKCHRKGHPVNETFDCTNQKHVKAWDSGDWYYDEDPTELWTPTDVHAATAMEAVPGLTKDSPDFKHFRSDYGKRINFSKNYGAGIGVTRRMFPEKSEAEINHIDGAYYRAFPGVKGYHSYCYDIVDYQGYATSLFGVRYYGMGGHHLTNYLVQGSGAQLLKLKLIDIWHYMRKHKLKSKLQMNIHDEISWLMHKLELDHIHSFKRIMEDVDLNVPIVADIDSTVTTWSEKKERTIDELKGLACC